MADTQTMALQVLSTPGDYQLSAAQQLTLGAIYAHYDGSGAGGSYIPTLDIISDSGHTVMSVPHDTTITAGSNAEASWAPFLKTQKASTGLTNALTQIWWSGSINNSTFSQSIPNNTLTQLTFSGSTGPGFGAGNPVEFDHATGAVRFNFTSGLGDLRWGRVSGIWDVAAGQKRVELQATAHGTAFPTLNGTITAAQWKPYSESNNSNDYMELSTIISPYVNTTLGDYMEVKAYVYQNTGGAINFTSAAFEVYITIDVNGDI